ncbi:MAG: hypothetical protein P8H23_05065 [Flavobacteriaceae bacterium]|nr:hypothetical protein [Flavobacteriaceae bacterium]
MTRNTLKYGSFIVGIFILIYTELYPISNVFISIGGLFLLVVGLYLISKGVGDKPEIDPYAVQSYDEEE